jgi:hypothetical protein
VSQNALRHGLTARRHVLLPGEQRGDYLRFVEAFEAALPCDDVAEEFCRSQMIDAAFRARRVPHIEAAILGWDMDTNTVAAPFIDAATNDLHNDEPRAGGGRRGRREKLWGRAFISPEATDALGKVSRGEAHLMRLFRSAWEMYSTLRARRQRPTSGGAIVDVEPVVSNSDSASALPSSPESEDPDSGA